MPIPRTRHDLVTLVTETANKLETDLAKVDASLADRVCVDDWTIRDLFVVRVWWTEAVVSWVEAGRRGERPVVPAEGYRFSETPRLNADLIAASRDDFERLVARWKKGVTRVLATIDALDDDELLSIGAFEWAGNYPIARWLSINTSTQYTSARKYVRRVLRDEGLL